MAALFAVFCVAQVTSTILNGILRDTYNDPAGVDTAPALYVLNTQQIPTVGSGAQPSTPNQPQFNSFPFENFDATQLNAFIQTNRANAAIALNNFLIIDSRTLTDSSLRLVEYRPQETPDLVSVRVNATQANAVITAIDVGTLDVEAVSSLLDADGVFRGGGRRQALVVQGAS